MSNVFNPDPRNKSFVATDGRTYLATRQGSRLATPLERALHRTARIQIGGFRDEE